MKKKVLAMICALCMVLGMTSVAYAAEPAMGETPDTAEDIGWLATGPSSPLYTKLTPDITTNQYYFSYYAERDGEVVVALNSQNPSFNRDAYEVTLDNWDTYQGVYSWDGWTPIEIAGTGESYQGLKISCKEGEKIIFSIKALDPSVEITDKSVELWVSNQSAGAAGTSPDNPISADKAQELTIPAQSTVYITCPGLEYKTCTVQSQPGTKFSVGNYTRGDAEESVGATASVEVKPGRWGADPMIEITNTGEFGEIPCRVSFADPVGTINNPKEITDLAKEYPTELTGTDHYYYKWVAEEDGELTVTMSFDKKHWTYSVDKTGVMLSSSWDDEKPSLTQTIAVKAGDEVTIHMGAALIEEDSGITPDPAKNATVKASFKDTATIEAEKLAEKVKEVEAAKDGEYVVTDGELEPEIVAAAEKNNVTLVLELDVEAEETTVAVAILNAVKGKDVDVKVVVGDYAWIVNGKSITADLTEGVDFAVSDLTDITDEAVKEVADKKPSFQINVANDLEVNANLTVETENAGKYAWLYAYEDGKLVYQTSVKVDAKGYATFAVNEAGDYLVVINDTAEPEVPTTPDPEPTVPEKGDATAMMYLVILMGAAFVGAGFVAKKRLAK